MDSPMREVKRRKDGQREGTKWKALGRYEAKQTSRGGLRRKSQRERRN